MSIPLSVWERRAPGRTCTGGLALSPAGWGARRAELAEVRRDLRDLGERVARIEGTLSGPWRPTNGSPAAVPKGGTSEATAE